MTDLQQIDHQGWRARGRDLRGAYLAGHPWPHLAIQDLFPADLVREAELQEMPKALHLPTRRMYRQRKAESSTVTGSAAASLLAQLDSEDFVGFLEELTGVADLIADPSHTWGGLHVNGPGSFHSVHWDFPKHPVSRLWHRVNVLVYLNSAWPSSYGGDLELWDRDMKRCEGRVRPLAGTVMIFETSRRTLHGLPDPIDCPEGEARLSLATNYYTATPPPEHEAQPLLTRPKRPQDAWWLGLTSPTDLLAQLGAPAVERSAGLRRLIHGPAKPEHSAEVRQP